jgi:hypothetical protein
MEKDKALTGAIAIIKRNGKAVGHMRDVTITETFNRAEVKQLGSILPLEKPVVGWSGSLSCGFYFIDLKKSGVPEAVIRQVQNNQQFENNLVLDGDGVQVDLYKRLQDIIDPETKKISPKEEPICTIRRALIESDNLTISEGGVSGKNQTFSYLDPLILPD